MRRNKVVVGALLASVLALSTVEAVALSLSSSKLEIDWNSVSVTPESTLTLTPNGGFYSDALYQLSVRQAWFDSVGIASNELPRVQYQPLATPVSVDYTKQDGGGSITGSGESDAEHALLETHASDQDGDNSSSNLIGVNVSRGLRYEVSGAGHLDLSFDYAAWLDVSAEQSRYNNTSAAYTVRLLAQEYIINTDGSTAYLRSYDDLINKELSLLDGSDSFYAADTSSLGLDFDGIQDRLLLITLYGDSRAIAASGVAASTTVPEPGTLGLLALGLLMTGWARTRALS